MESTDIVKSTIIENLKKIDISKINDYGLSNQRILDFSYKQGVINDSSIESALEYAVLKQARKDYESLIINKELYEEHADHVSRTDCFAYALDKKEFSKEEIEKIPFEYGENQISFSQSYGKKNLLSILRKDLLNPTIIPDSNTYYDPHPSH